jgi:hypothetical protein
MPPAPHSLRPRAEGGNKPFVIVFAVVASVVITVCFLWGCYWKKKNPGPLLHTRSNGFDSQKDKKAKYTSRRPFPSHHSSLRRFNKQPTREPSNRGPRIETPFVRSLPTGDTIKLSSLNPKYLSPPNLQDQIDSHRLFLSTRDSTAQLLQEHPDSVTRTPRTRTALAKHETNVGEFGDAKEYILALPEPLALKAKPSRAYRV